MEENKKLQNNYSGIKTKAELISFAMDLGISIAVPLAIFAFGGAYFDKKFETSPLLLIIGLLLSLASTTVIMMKKIKKFTK